MNYKHLKYCSGLLLLAVLQTVYAGDKNAPAVHVEPLKRPVASPFQDCSRDRGQKK